MRTRRWHRSPGRMRKRRAVAPSSRPGCLRISRLEKSRSLGHLRRGGSGDSPSDCAMLVGSNSALTASARATPATSESCGSSLAWPQTVKRRLAWRLPSRLVQFRPSRPRPAVWRRAITHRRAGFTGRRQSRCFGVCRTGFVERDDGSWVIAGDEGILHRPPGAHKRSDFAAACAASTIGPPS